MQVDYGIILVNLIETSSFNSCGKMAVEEED